MAPLSKSLARAGARVCAPRTQAKRVALVAPDLEANGGVQSVVDFFHAILTDSSRYHVDLISLATAASDANSRRMLAPATWLRGPTLRDTQRRELRVIHAGCNFAEIEFQRYKPRGGLTALLNGYDVVQIVAGTPAWALVAGDVRRPVVLQVATLSSIERRSILSQQHHGRAIWRRLMEKRTQRLDELALERCHTVFVENIWMYEYASRLRHDRRVILRA